MRERLDVGVVGAGRVGAVWGAALAAAGHRIVAASGASEASRNRVEALLGGVPLVDAETVVRSADLVLVTVPDDAVARFVDDMAGRGAWRRGQIAVHASGRHGLAVFASAEDAGVACLAIHPAMTFTGTSLDLVRMGEAAFAVTAPPALVPLAEALVAQLGGEAVVVAEADRPLYHAALVHGANHAVALVAQARAALAAAGIAEPARVLRPLVRASVDGALDDAENPVAALTGPVVRGDAETVAAHVAALSRFPETLETYRTLARATAALAHASGRLAETEYASVMRALEAS